MFKNLVTVFVLIAFHINPIDAYEISPEQKTAYGILMKNLGHSRHKVRKSSQKALLEQITSHINENMREVELAVIDLDIRVLDITPYEEYFQKYKEDNREELQDPEIRVRLNELWNELEERVIHIKINGLYLRSDNNKWLVVAYDENSPLGKDPEFLKIVKENKVLYVNYIGLVKQSVDLEEPLEEKDMFLEELGIDDADFELDEATRISAKSNSVELYKVSLTGGDFEVRGNKHFNPHIDLFLETLAIKKFVVLLGMLDKKLANGSHKLSVIMFQNSTNELFDWLNKQ